MISGTDVPLPDKKQPTHKLAHSRSGGAFPPPDPINICLLLSCKTGKFYFLLYFYNLSRFCFSHCFLHYQHGSFHCHSCSYLKFLCNFCCFYSQIHSFFSFVTLQILPIYNCTFVIALSFYLHFITFLIVFL